MTGPTHHSRFGGLWTDRLDAFHEIERRAERGAIDSKSAELLREWSKDGYVILPGAVDVGLCDRLRSDLEGAWRAGDARLLVFPPGDAKPQRLTAGLASDRMKLVDAYAYFESARQVLFCDAISHFLRTIFESAPLLFQSLSFEKGSEQGIHQDTAYVVVSSPLEMAASWVALEDVTPGSGELEYYVGSHRLPEYVFSSKFKHWNPERDGRAQHEESARLMHENAQRLGLIRRSFLAKKGDALIWSADLAHGGSPIADRHRTRRSIVGHYCPRTVRPHYFGYLPERRTAVRWGGASYSSAHYAL